MKQLKNYSTLALAYFFIIATLGVMLRLFPITPISVNYKFIVHTHSHVALLGWVYTALTTLIYLLYLRNSQINRRFKNIFIFTQITIIGMLVSFPFMGYKFFSILFSTLFLIASYLFSWLVFKYTPTESKQTNSYKLIRIALWYMIISSFGPWTLGAIMSTLGQGSSLYKNAIYFYLHFQYNGWFLVALLGVFTRILEQQNIEFTKKEFSIIYWLFNTGIVSTFLISILWMTPNKSINTIAGIGSIFQLIAFIIFLKKLNKIKLKSSQFLLKVFITFFLIKLIMQLLGCIPYFSSSISYNVDLVIGYIHWVFLGIVSIGLLSLLSHFKLIKITKSVIVLYIIGFLLTEFLLFYKGANIWLESDVTANYYHYLIGASVLLFLSIMRLLILQLKRK
jgi:hypothetical protein